MELNKRKYKNKEVALIVEAYKSEYEKLVLELKSRINELNKENKALLEQVQQYRQRERLIIKTLESAEQSAEQIKEQAQIEYALELQRLKEFSRKWDKYFNNIKEKYPLNNAMEKALEIKNQVEVLSEDNTPKQAIEKLGDMISEQNRAFNPKTKIKEYISATVSESGFNLNDVLNPGKLELEDLCKELGLIEEE